MRFLVSYTVQQGDVDSAREGPRRLRVTDNNVVPLDDEARALPATRRAHAVRAILLGQLAGQIQWAKN